MRMVVLAVAAMACAAPALAEPWSGSWRGVGLQAGPAGAQSTWTIDMRIDARGASKIDYPSLKCGGELREVSRGVNQIEFAEKITYGPCMDGGRIVAESRDGELYWFWRLPPGSPNGGDADASAVLYRPARIG